MQVGIIGLPLTAGAIDGPPNPRVELTELGRQLRQDPVDHAADRAQGVIRRNSLLERQIAPHPSLLPIVTTHARLHGKNYAHGRRTLMLTRHPKSGFSVSCYSVADGFP